MIGKYSIKGVIVTWLFAGMLSLCSCAVNSRPALDVDEQINYCQRQVSYSLDELSPLDYTKTPRNIMAGESHWNLRDATPEEWCAGFFPGILWMTYSTLEPQSEEAQRVLAAARGYTSNLEYLAHQSVYDHDLGFIMIGSFMKGWELTHDKHYREILLEAADTLATLYNPQVGTLLSWPRNVGMFGGHNTIIDNMLNLELLFWAAKNGGDSCLYDIAVSHADTTMTYHFRPDGTANHVAVYDSSTGQHLRNCNHQGYDDNSVWSRGQAWAIYGFTMVYRETKETRFLNQAIRSADAMLGMLPDDGIPYWDMKDPGIPDTYRDASAAAIIADALLELSDYVDAPLAQRYREQALNMLSTLSSDAYRCGKSKPAFLNHSVGNMPAGSEIDASINYADYYYLEALLRMKKQKPTQSP